MDGNGATMFELDFAKLSPDNQVYILGMIQALLFAQESDEMKK